MPPVHRFRSHVCMKQYAIIYELVYLSALHELCGCERRLDAD
jgi:hypothetical protein